MTLLESLSGESPKPRISPKSAVSTDPDTFCYDQDKTILYALAGK